MIGGDVTKVKKYISFCWEYITKMLDNKSLCTEESIMKPAFDKMNEDEVYTPTFTSFYCCEHDDFHFSLWQESWNQPKPFYMAWNDLIDNK